MNEPYYIQKVREFRELVGLKNDAETAKAITKEELYELFSARKLEDIADGAGDVIVTASGQYIDGHIDLNTWYVLVDNIYAFAEQFKINPNSSFDIVHASNMTKVCGAEHVEASIAKYAAIGVEAVAREVAPGRFAIYSAKDHGNDYIEGKLLKPVTYKAPDWSNKEEWSY